MQKKQVGRLSGPVDAVLTKKNMKVPRYGLV